MILVHDDDDAHKYVFFLSICSFTSADPVTRPHSCIAAVDVDVDLRSRRQPRVSPQHVVSVQHGHCQQEELRTLQYY